MAYTYVAIASTSASPSTSTSEGCLKGVHVGALGEAIKWVQEDDGNWGGTGGGGGWGGGRANPFVLLPPFILLHVMLKNYDTISLKKFLLSFSLINS